MRISEFNYRSGPQQCVCTNMLAQRAPLASRPVFSRPLVSRARAKQGRQAGVVRARFDSGRGSDRSVLEAFFLGRAFAETINDRLGAALGDFLSEIAKADAERRQAWREFENEVQDRASAALLKSTQTSKTAQKQLPENATVPRTTTGAPIGPVPRTTTGAPIAPVPRISTGAATGPVAGSNPQPQSSSASQQLLQETVDDVRAEVASTRAVLQQYKTSQNKSKQ